MWSPWSSRRRRRWPPPRLLGRATTRTTPASRRAAPTPPARTQIIERPYRRAPGALRLRVRRSAVGGRRLGSLAMAATEAELLDEINARLPEGVDWKQGPSPTCGSWWSRGASPRSGSTSDRSWAAPTTRCSGSTSSTSSTSSTPPRLAPGDLVIDVGCGPGWTIQWLAKLGHEVVGLDISAELLDIARAPHADRPYPPYMGQPSATTCASTTSRPSPSPSTARPAWPSSSPRCTTSTTPSPPCATPSPTWPTTASWR